MVTVFVFDAGVPIGLHKIHSLGEVVEGIEELGSRVILSSENLNEVGKRGSIEAKNILSEADCVKIISSEDYKDQYERLRQEWKQKRIVLSKKDTHVLVLAKIEKADFVVAQDSNVINKAKDIRNMYSLAYMVPMSNVDLLRHLYNEGCMTLENFVVKALKLYKRDGLDNVWNGINHREWDEEILKAHFQLYKDPIREAIREGGIYG